MGVTVEVSNRLCCRLPIASRILRSGYISREAPLPGYRWLRHSSLDDERRRQASCQVQPCAPTPLPRNRRSGRPCRRCARQSVPRGIPSRRDGAWLLQRVRLRRRIRVHAQSSGRAGQLAQRTAAARPCALRERMGHRAQWRSRPSGPDAASESRLQQWCVPWPNGRSGDRAEGSDRTRSRHRRWTVCHHGHVEV